MRFYWLMLVLVVLGLSGVRGATAAEGEPQRASLRTFYRLLAAGGSERLVETAESKAAVPAFEAVRTNQWVTGLVPVYAHVSEAGFRLGRLPPEGDENQSEPLFWALPPGQENDSALVAGPWLCRATRADGSTALLGWELAVHEGRVAGRFDPRSDYRVADLTAGQFTNSRLVFGAKYINDKYVIEGRLAEATLTLKGNWHHVDDLERGTWEATRPKGLIPPGSMKRAALYEWRHRSTDAVLYRLQGERLSADWAMAAKPLCIVWPVGGGGKS
jgi:hypothetical protein